MRKKWIAHGIALIGLVVFSVLGVGSAATTPAPRQAAVVPAAQPGQAEIMLVPSWSPYTLIPSMNYEVVGAVVVRDTSTETFLADLMERAIAMGGHFIKNVRLSVVTEGEGRNAVRSVNAATATVIRYTNESLQQAVTETFVVGGERLTVTTDHFLSIDGANEVQQ
ncbi:MAG: hypothetical protein FWB99_08355 [Treponema sp.]|nr:hypothetical protein [Treponema sp.]